MNNKYKSAFSLVAPSEKSVERIFAMTEKKKINFKPLLAIAVISTLLLASLVTANAMSGGSVLKGAENLSASEKTPQEKTDEEVTADLYVETTNDGEERLVFFDDDGEHKYYVKFYQTYDSGTAASVSAHIITEDTEDGELKVANISDGEAELARITINGLKTDIDKLTEE